MVAATRPTPPSPSVTIQAIPPSPIRRQQRRDTEQRDREHVLDLDRRRRHDIGGAARAGAHEPVEESGGTGCPRARPRRRAATSTARTGIDPGPVEHERAQRDHGEGPLHRPIGPDVDRLGPEATSRTLNVTAPKPGTQRGAVLHYSWKV